MRRPLRCKGFSAVTGLAALLLIVLSLSGCAGYHLGPIPPKFMTGVHSIAVPSFRNKTLNPRLEVLAAGTLISQFQQDGTFRVEASKNADAILDGTVTEIRRSGALSVESNVLQQSAYNLSVIITYTLTRRSTGEQLDVGTVSGTTSFFVSGSDVNQDEQQAIPLALHDASVHLVSRLTEGW
jgi:hypothetical protein